VILPTGGTYEKLRIKSTRSKLGLLPFAVFGMVLTSGSAIAQLVIDYETVVVSFIEVLDEIKDQDRDEVFSGRPGDERFSARAGHQLFEKKSSPGLF
jgi:hypothetical protein